MHQDSSRQIAARAAEALRTHSEDVRDVVATIGLDGFVDHIIRVVDKRSGPGSDGFEPMRSMRAMAEQIQNAAGRSANIELVVERSKFGGNGPIMADALAALGARVRCIGAIGKGGPHPIFAELAGACERVCAAGPPGETEALEFDDGKIMLGKIEAMDQMDFDQLVNSAGGIEELAALFSGASIISMNNWTMIQAMNDIWERFSKEIAPRIAAASDATFFIDLADPAKRSDEDLSCAIERLRSINEQMPVALGVNRSEAERLSRLSGARAVGDALEQIAVVLRAALELSTVVVHDRRGAGGATADAGASITGPFVEEPRISTGAGDHFNAGVSLGLALGLPLDQALATGVGVGGLYVRTGESPTLDELAGFLAALPAPE